MNLLDFFILGVQTAVNVLALLAGIAVVALALLLVLTALERVLERFYGDG